MIDFIEAVRRTLRRDVLVRDLVGFDKDHEVKVAGTVAKTNWQAPYVVVQLAPNATPVSVYGDQYTIETFTAQITSWHTDHRKVQQLAEAVDDAIHRGDYETTPYKLLIVKRALTPGEQGDRDTNWRQIPVQYDFAFSTEGRVPNV